MAKRERNTEPVAAPLDPAAAYKAACEQVATLAAKLTPHQLRRHADGVPGETEDEIRYAKAREAKRLAYRAMTERGADAQGPNK